MSILLFFLVLFPLILVHEWGHFIAAKKTGMRVDEFGIGFPPKLFGIKRGGTLYTFNLLPIGGFVKIYGENAADAAADSTAGQIVTDSFTSKSKWAQALVLVAGVVMNILFAWGLFAVALMVGVPTAVDEAVAGPAVELKVQGVLAESPAARAGLPTGATITGVVFEGVAVSTKTPTAFRTFTEDHADQAMTIAYTYHGESGTVEVVPKTGLIPENTAQAAIGVSLALVETVSAPFHIALIDAAKQTGSMLWRITVGILTLFAAAVTGTADFSSVTGPVGIVGLVGEAATLGVTTLLLFTAAISLNLAVINLMPFPALDGGRLLFVAIEAITRRTIAPIWQLRLNTIGFALLMLLMVAVTWNDIARLL